MKIVIDEDKYDLLQVEIVHAIVCAAHRALQAVGLPRETLKGSVTSIVFEVCCIVDASTRVVGKNGLIQPVLTFAINDAKTELLSSGGTSYMHEYVDGVIDEYFESI